MNAIFFKDLQLVWRTFKNYILIGALILLVGAIGFFLWGSQAPATSVESNDRWHKMGVNSGTVPEQVISQLRDLEYFTFVLYDSKESLEQGIKTENLRYVVDVNEGALEIGLKNQSDMARLVQSQIIGVSLQGLDNDLRITSFTDKDPRRYQSFLIWFGFIGLLMIGNSLCNILVWEERAKGNLEELVASPVSRIQIILAKLSSVLATTVGMCLGSIVVIAVFSIVAMTVIIMNNDSLLHLTLGSMGQQAVEGNQGAFDASAVDVAGAFVSWANFSKIGLMLLSIFFGLLALTTLLVVINFLVREQATLRFVITPLVLLVYGIPWVISFETASGLDLHWIAPVVNVYFTSAYEIGNQVGPFVWLPTAMVNASAFLLILGIGVYLVGKLEDWPSR